MYDDILSIVYSVGMKTQYTETWVAILPWFPWSDSIALLTTSIYIFIGLVTGEQGLSEWVI